MSRWPDNYISREKARCMGAFASRSRAADEIVSLVRGRIEKYPHCGLTWYGVDYNMGPLWMLSGITPVGLDYAIKTLADIGESVADIQRLRAEQERRAGIAHARKDRLIASAKKKLTPAEISACEL